MSIQDPAASAAVVRVPLLQPHVAGSAGCASLALVSAVGDALAGLGDACYASPLPDALSVACLLALDAAVDVDEHPAGAAPDVANVTARAAKCLMNLLPCQPCWDQNLLVVRCLAGLWRGQSQLDPSEKESLWRRFVDLVEACATYTVGTKRIRFELLPEEELIPSTTTTIPPQDTMEPSRRPQTDLTEHLLGHLLNPVSRTASARVEDAPNVLVGEMLRAWNAESLIEEMLHLPLKQKVLAAIVPNSAWQAKAEDFMDARLPDLTQLNNEMSFMLRIVQIIPASLWTELSKERLTLIARMAFSALWVAILVHERYSSSECAEEDLMLLTDTCLQIWDACLAIVANSSEKTHSSLLQTKWKFLSAALILRGFLHTTEAVATRKMKRHSLVVVSKLLDIVGQLFEFAQGCVSSPENNSLQMSSVEISSIDPVKTVLTNSQLGSEINRLAPTLFSKLLQFAASAHAYALMENQRRNGAKVARPESSTSQSDAVKGVSSVSSVCQEDDEDDILGKWLFDEPSSAPASASAGMAAKESDTESGAAAAAAASTSSSIDSMMCSQEQGLSDHALQLSIRAFTFCNMYLTNLGPIRHRVRTRITSTEIHRLAKLIQGMEVGADSSWCQAAAAGFLRLHSQFSIAVMTLCHNILAYDMLAPVMQDSLLETLGIQLTRGDRAPWPLYISPNVLSLVTQILLIRQHRRPTSEKAKKSTSHPYVIIWDRALSSLLASLTEDNDETSRTSDLNVEHAQFLLFLFHALPLMQKKHVLLSASAKLSSVARFIETLGNRVLSSKSILCLTRLVLLFEYLMKNLYEPPPELLTHIQKNLFHKDTMQDDFQSQPVFFPFSVQEQKASREFYNLFPYTEHVMVSETPKLDGLAVSFICAGSGQPELYHELYLALVAMLAILQQVEHSTDDMQNKCIQYAFLVTWRTLTSLPPSKCFLLSMRSPDKLAHSCLMHATVLAARLDNSAWNKWIQEVLVKQGLEKEAAATLCQEVSTCFRSIDTMTILIDLAVKEAMGNESLPTFQQLLVWHVILCNMHTRTSREGFHDSLDVPVRSIVKSLASLLQGSKKLLLSLEPSTDATQKDCQSLDANTLTRCIAICNPKAVDLADVNGSLQDLLPAEIKRNLADWNKNALKLPVKTDDSKLNHTVKTSLWSLTNQGLPGSHMRTAFKQCLWYAAQLTLNLFCQSDRLQEHDVDCLSGAFYSLVLDGCAEYLSEIVAPLQREKAGEASQCEELLLRYFENAVVILDASSSGQNLKIASSIVHVMACLLKEKAGVRALHRVCVLEQRFDLASLLLSIGSAIMNGTSNYAKEVIFFFESFFKKMQANYEAKEDDAAAAATDAQGSMLESLSQSLLQSKLLEVQERVNMWIATLVNADVDTFDNSRECLKFLQMFVKYLCQEASRTGYTTLPLAVLHACRPLGTSTLTPKHEGVPFVELFELMQALARAVNNGKSYLDLLASSKKWLHICKSYLEKKDVTQKMQLQTTGGQHVIMIENASRILKYISLFLTVVSSHDAEKSSQLDQDTSEGLGDPDNEWPDDDPCDEDDSGAEESDEEELCNKLCTYTVTQKEFMNQHWYHCHTCEMIDGIGVCTICAKVCHSGHDITYSKFGSFFCDCGAMEDGSCRALTKRNPNQQGSAAEARFTASGLAADLDHSGAATSFARRTADTSVSVAVPRKSKKKDPEIEAIEREKIALYQQVAVYKEHIAEELKDLKDVMNALLDMLQELTPVIKSVGEKHSWIGHLSTVRSALHVLQSNVAEVELYDSLMMPTLGSQEGAFENVRMNYSGDHAQTLRQLLSAHMVKRVIMCCLVSAGLSGNSSRQKQHLAVAHEKGKITILQLSALLKQADSSQKKLTLTRLSSSPIPFTVLSLVPNPLNDEVLAVIGLKECHVIKLPSLGNGGTDQNNHLVLQPQLDANNYIIKALWIPGSQTKLALITADFVKVYDLSVDLTTPEYWFVVPCGKIRDCTFAFLGDDNGTSGSCTTYALLLSSTGNIYYEALMESTSAENGSFYITNILEVKHDAIRIGSSDHVCGGGVSIFYYHALQYLFVSYVSGKTFAGTLRAFTEDQELENVCQIEFHSSSSSSAPSSSGRSIQQQPLYQWSEVNGHPGLVTAFIQQSNNPVVLMIKEKTILVQEIRTTSKAKILDMVTLRHPVGADKYRTTLILLCDDGSLKIFMANPDSTFFWLQPSKKVHPLELIIQSKPPRKKRLDPQPLNVDGAQSTSSSAPFPIDFFEPCTRATFAELEFAGNDLLQVYNVEQIKHRLQTPGLYLASTKPTGFTLEVGLTESTSAAQAIVGLRVLLGNHDPTRVPSYIQIFNRRHPVHLTRGRWFDLPLSREETFMAEKKISLIFGPSLDPGGVMMIDNIQVYVKSKDALGWAEDADEAADTLTGGSGGTRDGSLSNGGEMTSLCYAESLIGDLSNVLELYYRFFAKSHMPQDARGKSQVCQLMSHFILMPGGDKMRQTFEAIMSTQFQNQYEFYNYKDELLITHAFQEMMKNGVSNVDYFHHFLLVCRNIATSRPLNLIRFAKKVHGSGGSGGHTFAFMGSLMERFWQLLQQRPANISVGILGQQGLSHVGATVQTLIEIMHALSLAEDPSVATSFAKIYVDLLLYKDIEVGFPAKQALLRCLRPKVKKKKNPPPTASAPAAAQASAATGASATPGSGGPSLEPLQVIHRNEPSRLEAMFNIAPGAEGLGGIAGNLEALLPGEGAGGNDNLPIVLDAMAGEVDDEAMMDLAIALSLQDQPGGVQLEQRIQQGLQGLQGLRQGLEQLVNLEDIPALQGLAGVLRGELADELVDEGDQQPETDDPGNEVHQGEGTSGQDNASADQEDPSDDLGDGGSVDGGQGGNSEPAHFSDTTASGPGTDYEEEDELEDNAPGLQASLVQTPKSESTERKSEEAVTEAVTVVEKPPAQEQCAPPSANTQLTQERQLHHLRLLILDHLLQSVPRLPAVGGLHSLPFLQVILMLTSGLNTAEERDLSTLDRLLSSFLSTFNANSSNLEVRTQESEVLLVLMRFFSVLMSRSKSWQHYGGLNTSGTSQSSIFKTVSSSSDSNPSVMTVRTAKALHESECLASSLAVLEKLLPYWNSQGDNSATGSSTQPSVLKAQPVHSLPDLSPFFLKQYVKGHAHDVFEAYPQLLTEMALRIPYQVKKVCEMIASSSAGETSKHKTPSEQTLDIKFNSRWFHCLGEYMMSQQTPFVRRQVRKLLLYISGSKENYRQVRDWHSLESRLKIVQKETSTDENALNSDDDKSDELALSYDKLLQVLEHLKACLDVAASRTMNWQKFCLEHPTTLSFLFHKSLCLDDSVSSILLQLLQNAMCWMPVKGKQKSERSSKKKDEDSMNLTVSRAQQLVQQLTKHLTDPALAHFVQRFLFECNSTSIRWQAHALVLHLYQHSDANTQRFILNILWELWTDLPLHGRKAAQFVDLLGYITINSTEFQNDEQLNSFVKKAFGLLKQQNRTLSVHPNATLYGNLRKYMDLKGYYLESNPCLVCNSPEIPYSSLKLSTLRGDTKYTTSTQLVRLSTSHSISKIYLRIGELKRQKMVRTINLYYNCRSVQGVVELKRTGTQWSLAKKVLLHAGQTDIKVEFALPIVACNLKIEYADFFENVSASNEMLQCPRCSNSVPANPGVCPNCGENVFQCHKCRSINYDERDPFLCHACGFCKYAKFEYTLHCRPCCAVDSINNDDDRKKAVANINAHLERADRLHRSLVANRPQLEELLRNITSKHCRMDSAAVPLTRGSMGHMQHQAAVHRSTATLQGFASAMLGSSGGSSQAGTVPGSYVSMDIHELTHKYGSECRSIFEELSQIIQNVLVTRRELKRYDESLTPARRRPKSQGTVNQGSCCYGCATFAVEHCLTLLRALAIRPKARALLCNEGLMRELLENNLRNGSDSMRLQVRKLMTGLTKDNPLATKNLDDLLLKRILGTLRSRKHAFGGDLVDAVQEEMALVTNGLAQDEENSACWEERVKCVLKIFLFSTKNIQRIPAFVECVILPCLKILQRVTLQSVAGDKNDSKKQNFTSINLLGWLDGNSVMDFSEWQQESKVREIQLASRYFYRWLHRVFPKGSESTCYSLLPMPESWLKWILFNQTSQAARQMVSDMISCFAASSYQRKKALLDLLVSYLACATLYGNASAEYFNIFQALLSEDWMLYLTLKGVVTQVSSLVCKEIENLKILESQSPLSGTDMSQGFCLNALVDLLASFLRVGRIKSACKSKLLSPVLHSYVSLRQLVVQRTKLIDEAEEKMLQLLEEITTGTVEETKAFMAVCIETIRECPLDDHMTPVFILERLCNIIYPEETETGEFLMILEKDAMQEEFLQGRMLGNPYKSTEPGLGPLMRDIKIKICHDCELVALLEEDSSMELLVNNKIISLELPVEEVYQKIWLPQVVGNGPAEGVDPMKIIYRMRGLMGDATEEFVENLDSKESDEDAEEEEIYKLAQVLSECNGLSVLLERLATIQNASHSKQLLTVLLKLLSYCMMLKCNRQHLLNPHLSAVPQLLRALRLCLSSSEQDSSIEPLTEQILALLERLFVTASAEGSLDKYAQFASRGVSKDDLDFLLSSAVKQKPGTALHSALMRVLPFLSYANEAYMEQLLSHFRDVLDLENYNEHYDSALESKMEAFVSMMETIEANAIGNTLKEKLLGMGIVEQFIVHLDSHSPPATATPLSASKKSDDPVHILWKEFLGKPSLRYVLRILAGLASHHEQTQMLIANRSVRVLHKLEQVSSEEHVGSLAEAVLESLHDCPEAQKMVAEAREQTKSEKKKLAMAMRAKQLKSIGLMANAQGQVKAESSLVKQFAQLEDDAEEGEGTVTCGICREGYKFQPSKVLAIYTFTSPCPMDDYQGRASPSLNQTQGYTTVSHFNLVHTECHSAAVRQARGRDEWESALLQNANTKCNGLLPLWGPQVPEPVFASSLARHNNYIAEATGFREVGYQSTIHDVRLLLMRFAEDRSFSDESGGGGPESNLRMIPYLLHIALYVLNSTRSDAREQTRLATFLNDKPTQDLVQSAYAVEGPFYHALLALLVIPPNKYTDEFRLSLLRRLLISAHARTLHPYLIPTEPLIKNPLPYSAYRKACVYFCLIDLLYKHLFSTVKQGDGGAPWSQSVANWIRNNDTAIFKGTTKVLDAFQEEVSPAASIDEILDICGLLTEQTMQNHFIENILKEI